MSNAEQHNAPIIDSTEIIAEVVDSRRPLRRYRSHAPNPPRMLDTAIFSVLVFIAVIFPIFFGGVHATSYLPMYAAIFALTALVLIVKRSQIDAILGRSTSFALGVWSVRLILAFAALAAILALSNIWSPAPHPILGTSPEYVHPVGTSTALLDIMAFVALFFLTRVALSGGRASTRAIERLLMAAAVVVAMLALGHWFYDNGKLFGVFSPDYEFVSNRARWPFVNPNHLGHFLLPLAFVVAGCVASYADEALSIRRERKFRKGQDVVAVLTDKRFQACLAKAAMAFSALLVTLISLLASQSRSSWLGLSLGIATYLIFSMIRSSDDKAIDVLLNPVRKEHAVRRGSRRERVVVTLAALATFWRFARRPLIFIFAVLLLLFFLNQRGRELIVDRLQFGLAHSKDDMRWQLYTDSMPMIREHLWFGVGLGNWNATYPRYMDSQLGGINPVYLHSDPLQALAETGVVGVTPLVLLLLLLVARTPFALRQVGPTETSVVPEPPLASSQGGSSKRAVPAPAVPTSTRQMKQRLRFLMAGAVAFLGAASLDFPLHVGAIAMLSAIYLALTTFYVDRLTGLIQVQKHSAQQR